MLKNLINLILNLFGGKSKGDTAQAEGDWSSGDYDRYAELKKQKREEYLAQKESQQNGDKA